MDTKSDHFQLKWNAYYSTCNWVHSKIVYASSRCYERHLMSTHQPSSLQCIATGLPHYGPTPEERNTLVSNTHYGLMRAKASEDFESATYMYNCNSLKEMWLFLAGTRGGHSQRCCSNSGNWGETNFDCRFGLLTAWLHCKRGPWPFDRTGINIFTPWPWA